MTLTKHRAVPALLLTLSVLVFAAVSAPRAQAVDVSANKVTGGTTHMDVPFSLLQALGPDRIFVRVTPPATLTFPNFFPVANFPVTGGLVETATMLGTVNHSGGMNIYQIDETYTNIVKELNISDLKIVNGTQLVGNAFDLIPSPAADLKNPQHSYDSSTGVLHFEADAEIGLPTALVLNTYFNTNVFKAGMSLGHVYSDIQTERLIGIGIG